MRCEWLAILLVGFAVLGISGSADATQWDPMSWEERLTRSDLIAQGRVLKCDAQWGHRYIYRDCQFEIREMFFGNPRASVTVRSFGGSVGDYTLSVSGTPSLRAHRDLFLFLKKNEMSDTWHVVGMAQGEFEVWGESLVKINERPGPSELMTQILTLEDVRTLVALGN